MIAFVKKFQSQVFFTLFTVECRLLNKYVHQIDKAFSTTNALVSSVECRLLNKYVYQIDKTFSTTSALVSLSSDQTVFLEELPNQSWRSNTGEQWQHLKQ